MSARRLIDLAKREGLLSDKFSGKTPHQTMKSKLSVDIRRKGEQSRFTRVRPGQFFLRELVAEGAEYRPAPLRPAPPREQVLVVPNDRLDELGRFQGVTKAWKRRYAALLRSDLTVLERMSAEQDARWKQIITYIIVSRGQSILAFRRGIFNRVEDNLRGAECIGFGGHVMATDANLFSSSDYGIGESAVRELREELSLPERDVNRLHAGGLSIVGLLNEDSSPAGRRHMALVMNYEVSDDPAWETPQRGEKSITQLRWIDTERAAFRIHDFEYWSQLCLRAYYPRAVRAQASFSIRRRRPFQPPHLMCVLGPIGSGKTEATARLKHVYGYVEINSGRVLADVLGLAPIPATPRAQFHDEAWKFITSKAGPRRLALALHEAAEATGTDRILIDGIRQRSTLEELRRLSVGRRIAHLYVHTPPDLAYDLYRRRENAGISVDEFFALRESPVESEANTFIEVADAVLYNWIGVSGYAQALDELMSDVGIGPARRHASRSGSGA